MKVANRIVFSMIILIAVLLIGGGIFLWWDFLARRANDVPVAQPGATDIPQLSVMAKNLNIPWALDFLPDGSIIFTERTGTFRLIKPDGLLLAQPILTLSDVAAQGEGGLLGIALHPSFAINHYVFIYYTYSTSGTLQNHVVRYTWDGQTLVGPHIILDGIPGGGIHNGGRVKFGPDACLYVTTGETGNTSLSQNLASLGGKILRIKDDGAIPADNPFPGSPVYSYGHRNPEGLAWDSQGRLWATEHGSSAYDELNLIQPGRNYGWPLMRGDETVPGMETPVLNSGTDTWAPSGIAFYPGSLYFAGLRGQSLFRVDLADSPLILKTYFNGNFGRLREVVVGPDGMLYLLTSNRDGRGVPTSDDDQMLRINPSKL